MEPWADEDLSWWQAVLIAMICYVEIYSFDAINIEIPDWLESKAFLSWRNNLMALSLHDLAAMSVPEDTQ